MGVQTKIVNKENQSEQEVYCIKTGKLNHVAFINDVELVAFFKSKFLIVRSLVLDIYR